MLMQKNISKHLDDNIRNYFREIYSNVNAVYLIKSKTYVSSILNNDFLFEHNFKEIDNNILNDIGHPYTYIDKYMHTTNIDYLNSMSEFLNNVYFIKLKELVRKHSDKSDIMEVTNNITINLIIDDLYNFVVNDSEVIKDFDTNSYCGVKYKPKYGTIPEAFRNYLLTLRNKTNTSKEKIDVLTDDLFFFDIIEIDI